MSPLVTHEEMQMKTSDTTTKVCQTPRSKNGQDCYADLLHWQSPVPGVSVREVPQAQAQEQEMKTLPTQSITGKTEQLIECKNIVRKFNVGSENELEILHNISLTIYKGEFVAIVGASGSGKSTLMNIIGALDLPTSGTCTLGGVELTTAKEDALSDLRNLQIGFVFQSYNLIGRTSALENVALPLMYAHVPQRSRIKRAKEMLELVGMSERATHTPSAMSGGQRQRVSIARAMANDPPLILADEATGALDSKTGHLIMDIFHELHEKHGKTIVFVTHSPELAEECERMVTIKDGRIISDRKGRGRAYVG